MRLRTIILLLFLSGFCFSFYGQTASPFEDNNPIESNTLPSEQTMSDLEQSPKRPGLRGAPGDIDSGDSGNKLPIGAPTFFTLISLSSILGIYGLYKHKQNNKTTRI